MDDGRVVAVEALVRWRHPAKGLVPPGSFLTAARRVGLMGALTESTIRMAVADAVSWRAQGLPMKVALNIAPTELLRVDTMGLLMELVATEGLTHEAIIVEVTEDSFLAAPDRTREVIGRLRAGGIEVSIDDYGTGYSSLSYLQDLPLHELKIDRTFVSRVDNDDRSRTIVSTTTELAHALGMRTVAEGVETAEVLAQVRRLDVDIVQGFYFAKPMPAAELLQWLRAHSPASVLETLTVAR